MNNSNKLLNRKDVNIEVDHSKGNFCCSCCCIKQCADTEWDECFTILYVFYSILLLLGLTLGTILAGPVAFAGFALNYSDRIAENNSMKSPLYIALLVVGSFLAGTVVQGILGCLSAILLCLSIAIPCLNPFFVMWYYLSKAQDEKRRQKNSEYVDNSNNVNEQ